MTIDDLLYTSDMGFSIKKRTYNDRVEMSQTHYHCHYEILYIYHNSRILKIGDNEYTLDKGNVALIPPFIPHKTISGELIPQKRFLLNFRTDFLDNMKQILGIDLLACFNPSSPVISCEKFFNKFCKLLELLEDDFAKFQTNSGKALAILHLSEMLILFNENTVPHKNEKEIYKIIKFVEENFNKQITLSLLEKKFYMSKYSISRKFNAFTGSSLPKYLNTIRVIHAKKYIENHMKITDVALKCGFGSLGDFDRVFKAETGVSPLKYKESCLSK